MTIIIIPEWQTIMLKQRLCGDALPVLVMERLFFVVLRSSVTPA